MSKNVMAKIDKIAMKFYETKNKKYFNTFIKYANPTIKRFINKSCFESSWDTDELYSILLVDMWRLFNTWTPEEEKQFHWLMLRQLRNKIINYIHSQIGRPHKICPVCNTRQIKGSSVCNKCKSSLRVSDIIIAEPFDYSCAHFPNYLEQIANKELVGKLLDEVEENDPKTHKILTMLLEGESKTTISNEVKIAQNALNNRLRKCRKIIDKLMRTNI